MAKHYTGTDEDYRLMDRFFDATEELVHDTVDGIARYVDEELYHTTDKLCNLACEPENIELIVEELRKASDAFNRAASTIEEIGWARESANDALCAAVGGFKAAGRC